MLGYIADLSTYVIKSADLLSLSLNSFSGTPVIGAGTIGQFDECGAWIHGADMNGSTVYAWYHAEAGYCHNEGANAHTIKSIGFAQSTDGGLTFTKPAYPDNIIISDTASAIAAASPSQPAGNGDFSVVKVGSYYYVFFINTSLGNSSVARASIASNGAPGSWNKWFNGSFSEPGVGGQTSLIGATLGGVSYNTKLNMFVGPTYQDQNGVGFQLGFSPDATTWTVPAGPLIPGGHLWSQSQDTSHGYSGYPSIIAADGSKNWTDSFYLYYMYIRPGDNSGHRFLLRSKVTMTVASSPLTAPRVTTDLIRYASPSSGRHWVTSELAVPMQGNWDFASEGRLGGVFTNPSDGLIELEDCVYGGINYMITIAGSGECTGAATVLRPIGWIYSPSTKQPEGTHAIFRCSTSGGDHFASNDPDCEGQSVDAMLGFAIN